MIGADKECSENLETDLEEGISAFVGEVKIENADTFSSDSIVHNFVSFDAGEEEMVGVNPMEHDYGKIQV